MDQRALAAALRRGVGGEVRFDDGARALYATDASNYRQVPIGVVLPRDCADVEAAVSICRRFGAPLLPRGGGTSLAGQGCNVAVVLDLSKYMNRIQWIDPTRGLARVQPGLILDDLRQASEAHHLTFGPDPATHTHCTLGGMIGNNSCGVHSVLAGKTVDNVEELEVLTYEGLRLRVGRTDEDELGRIIAAGGERGAIYAGLRGLRDRYGDLVRARYPRIPRRVSGYNLDELLPEQGFQVARALVGTEGTCVIVLSATVRLVRSPPCRSLLVLGYPDIFHAGDHVPEILEAGPIGLEGIDELLAQYMVRKELHAQDLALLPEGKGWLLVEFGGATRDEANGRAQRLIQRLEQRGGGPTMHLYDQKEQADKIWRIRESGLGATAFIPGLPDAWPGWEDSAVPPERLGDYLRDLRRLFDRFGYRCSLYGHFGQGCVHVRVPFDLRDAAGVRRYVSFLDEAVDLVVSYGGSLSGEHGDGQSRAALLPRMYGPELVDAFRAFKALWDPRGRMNPGKIVDPRRPDEDLRILSYPRWEPDTHFRFPTDEGKFSRAAMRCVGVGKCRRLDGGTMCPSFMVTREEEHTTRGRAHALFEMMMGDPIRGGWRDERVRESLDLCLSCKGCKRDCPVNVDMATYKAEFLSHYYAGRLRPRSAYAMGLIDVWARLASRVPGLANLASHAPGLGALFKGAAGLAQARTIPLFAEQTFQDWARGRGFRGPGSRGRVLLWPDTFVNHFQPEIGQAAVEVLEGAGYEVVVPGARLCCGRPLYDFGMLGRARRLLRRVMDELGGEIDAGTPLIGLEPSCAAVFRDELVNLFPEDERARKLCQNTRLLGEFLMEREVALPRLERRAIVHGHCHHQAVMTLDDEVGVLRRLGLDAKLLDAGCCGMAGSFGFEAAHHAVSIRVGERALLPAVRGAPREALIIADGFSCREQISQETERRALHLAEVIQMARREGSEGPRAAPPEARVARVCRERAQEAKLRRRGRWLVALGAVALLMLTVTGAVTIHERA